MTSRQPTDLFADVAHPDQMQTAWSILTENYGMVVRKWRAAWPAFHRVMSDPEVLAASIDVAIRGVMKWRPDRGTRLKTYVLNAVRFAALRAKGRHERERPSVRCQRTLDAIPARDADSAYYDESLYDTTRAERVAG